MAVHVPRATPVTSRRTSARRVERPPVLDVSHTPQGTGTARRVRRRHVCVRRRSVRSARWVPAISTAGLLAWPPADGSGLLGKSATAGISRSGVPFLGSMGGTAAEQAGRRMVASGTLHDWSPPTGRLQLRDISSLVPSARKRHSANPIVSIAPSYNTVGQPNGYWMLDAGGIDLRVRRRLGPLRSARPLTVPTPVCILSMDSGFGRSRG